MKYLINAFWGFCMALADSVPGVSGGTIAFILGFYDKFINALNDVFYGDFKKKKSALWFLFKLGTGWIIGMILATLVLTSLFESKIYSVSSLFLGFIVFSIPLIMKEEKDNIKCKYKNIIFTIGNAFFSVRATNPNEKNIIYSLQKNAIFLFLVELFPSTSKCIISCPKIAFISFFVKKLLIILLIGSIMAS